MRQSAKSAGQNAKTTLFDQEDNIQQGQGLGCTNERRGHSRVNASRC